MESRGTPMPARRAPPRSTSNESSVMEQNDGSQSDSAVSNSITEGRSKRRPSISHKMATFVGLRRRSSSATQLGTGKFSCVPGKCVLSHWW
ncbi:hypothetical protein DPMN_068693 [Dreissena polymorpha]|uniref:Uncharacterized protein n=1 Tax=Dreissena polymorpha TaxID=45954 RepID=A0A9D4BMF1_DREPO|nr:hypothetical protein DPMN_068693 [Dreissena polymorpha]